MFAFLVVVSLSCQAASNSLGNVGATLTPDVLVQLDIYADVFGAHLLEGKATDSLDSFGSSELSALAVDALVDVDGVLAGNDLLDGRALFAFFFGHFIGEFPERFRKKSVSST